MLRRQCRSRSRSAHLAAALHGLPTRLAGYKLKECRPAVERVKQLAPVHTERGSGEAGQTARASDSSAPDRAPLGAAELGAVVKGDSEQPGVRVHRHER